MPHLLTPITINGTKYCVDTGTKRTDVVLEGDAAADGTDQWELFRATAVPDVPPGTNPEAESPDAVTPRTYEGKVTFGVHGATEVELEIWGEIEVKNDGYDWCRVTLNPGTVDESVEFYEESEDYGSGDWFATVANPTSGVHTVTITLASRPCGNVIEIEGSTGDEKANNTTWWKVKIVSIT